VVKTTNVLDDKVFIFSKLPTKDESLEISITEENLEGYNLEWEFVNKPAGSNFTAGIGVSNGLGIKIAFTPDIDGSYTLKLTATKGDINTSKQTTFFIGNKISVNQEEVQNTNSTDNSSKIIGIVKNKYWVKSNSLSRT
jgi:hypothetical protein